MANPTKSRVYAAEFSFSNKVIQKKICDLGKAGVKVFVVLDAGSASNLDFIKQDPQGCQKDKTHPNLQATLLGGFTDFPKWRLHHNKTVIVDAGDGSPYDIDFSSGNLSVFGTSLHMDHWVLMKVPAQTNLARAELCLFEGLKAADAEAKADGMYAHGGADFDKDPAVTKAYSDARDACYAKNHVLAQKDYEKAISQDKIAPFYTPNNGGAAVSALKAQLNGIIAQAQSGKKGLYIYIAMEHFNRADIAALLNKAANAGVDVGIVFNSSTVTGTSEVEADKPFMEQNLNNPRIKLRFVETNPQAGGNGQQMHNKFTILNGQRIFSGAGHFTGGGLNNNWETLYLSQSPELTAKYAKYFKTLWDQSVDKAYLNTGSAIVPAPRLAKGLLDLANSAE
jgi:phosphatidylserine/phosphatidylglycerophosphate/cardiolipin synthase-like enzyme